MCVSSSLSSKRNNLTMRRMHRLPMSANPDLSYNCAIAGSPCRDAWGTSEPVLGECVNWPGCIPTEKRYERSEDAGAALEAEGDTSFLSSLVSALVCALGPWDARMYSAFKGSAHHVPMRYFG